MFNKMKFIMYMDLDVLYLCTTLKKYSFVYEKLSAIKQNVSVTDTILHKFHFFQTSTLFQKMEVPTVTRSIITTAK